MTRGPYMGHHIDFPYVLPFVVGHFRPAAHRNPGVATKQVDRAFLRFDIVDQRFDLGLACHVNLAPDPANLIGGRLGACLVQIGTDDPFRASRMKPHGQCIANSAGGASDHHDLVPDIHSPSPFRGKCGPLKARISKSSGAKSACLMAHQRCFRRPWFPHAPQPAVRSSFRSHCARNGR